MALARARRNETGFNYWPGFVDALSTLVLSIVFLLSVFLVEIGKHTSELQSPC